MNIKVFILATAVNVSTVSPMWAAQQSAPDATLLTQLENRLAQSDSESKRLTGAPKSLWLLREAKIEKIIARFKAGQTVDPKELESVLSGRVN
jgi:hypothetical protein